MRSPRPLAVILLMCSVLPTTVASAVTLHQPGYTVTPLLDLPYSFYSPSDIALDGVGNLYIPSQTLGVLRVSPTGTPVLWSSAPAVDLSLAQSGSGYAAGRGLCHCILAISADGSSTTLHSDGLDWTYVTLASDGTLYANIWAGAGEGIYQIDRLTGQPSQLVSGGGFYRDMAIGSDGKLYVLAASALLRLEGTHLVSVAPLPHGGINLTLGPDGLFYTTATSDTYGEVWIVDPATTSSSLLASGLAGPAGVAYDPLYRRLYVSEQYGQRTVFSFRRDETIAIPTSWGALKQIYR